MRAQLAFGRRGRQSLADLTGKRAAGRGQYRPPRWESTGRVEDVTSEKKTKKKRSTLVSKAVVKSASIDVLVSNAGIQASTD